ncbi:lysis protein [Pseudomonas sp. AFG_SD02_1510_Pfu_092]|uniref:lysis system i-spanin subunit Rz n=1 Tax=Pseudomonas sp. AFG_SD02_1510_Pfu_092 TaxID=2259497 RepID=UPI000DEF193D|nr:lysis system i-spanin subunit Rz [Pseudomonas sp. AFG_SD02_1510_Pfu_092]RCL23015.1 lysis protein [Pseudomonas sp. AFG_SD02_1510_Pfu_092]
MSGLNWRLTALALLLGLAVGGRSAWLWQANEYDKQLAEVREEYAQERSQASAKALGQLQTAQAERSALEQRLQASSATHYKELNDAQEDRKRLAGQLATANVRLSVLIDNAAVPIGGNCGLPTAAGTRRVVHGPARVQLDPAHAQRIIAITGEGDDGLKALQACQAYARSVSGGGNL